MPAKEPVQTKHFFPASRDHFDTLKRFAYFIFVILRVGGGTIFHTQQLGSPPGSMAGMTKEVCGLIMCVYQGIGVSHDRVFRAEGIASQNSLLAQMVARRVYRHTRAVTIEQVGQEIYAALLSSRGNWR